MKRMFIYFISILMVLLVQKDVLCNDEIPIKVDENIQSQIERIATETLSEGDLFQAVSNLDKDGKNIGRVLPQLILYEVNCIKEGKNITPAIFIFTQLYSNTSKKKLIKIIVPLIKIDNSDLQKVLGLYYDHISTSSDRTRDYSLFKAYLKKNKSKPPLELIGFMFEKSPDKAMMALLNSYLPRNKELALLVEKISSSKSEIRNMGLPYRLVRKKEEKGYDTIPDERWAEKCKEIKKNLYILSQYKEWWIKLYVSESIRKNPYFLETKTIEQLKKEEHPLVQKSLKEILSATN